MTTKITLTASEFAALKTRREKIDHVRSLDEAGHRALRLACMTSQNTDAAYALACREAEILHEGVHQHHRWFPQKVQLLKDLDREAGINVPAPTMSPETSAFIAMTDEQQYLYVDAMDSASRAALGRILSADDHSWVYARALHACAVMAVEAPHPFVAERDALRAHYAAARAKAGV